MYLLDTMDTKVPIVTMGFFLIMGEFWIISDILFLIELLNYGYTFELWVNFWIFGEHFIESPPIT